LNHLCY